MKKKGITLIALIITIVVLLILAGVTISFVVGDNGVVTQAQKSKTKTEKARFVEDAELAYSEIYAEKTNDIKIPDTMKVLSENDAKIVIDKIEQVLQSGKLTELYEIRNLILQEK